MRKIIKNNLGNFLIILLIFLMTVAWIFSSWPKIWQNPPIPPEIKDVKAGATLVQKATGQVAPGTSVSTTFPSAATANNLLIAICSARDTSILTGPSAFSTAINESGTPSQGIFYKIAAGGETSITCTSSVRTRLGIHIYEYSGIDTTSPLDGTGSSTGSGTSVASGSVTTSNANNLLIAGLVINANTSFTAWTNFFTEQNDFVNTGAAASRSTYGGADRIVSATGTYSTTATAGLSGAWRGQIAAFKEIPLIITVSTTGTQVSSMTIPSTNNYVGGAFTFVRNVGSANVTSITITETGTVNANLNLSNVKLFYETTATCTYDGTEFQFGTAQSFNASEKVTITGTMSVGTSQVCLYVVLDVGSGAGDGQTLDIEISNPSAEITVSAGTVTPATPVAIAGTTTLQVPVVPPATWREAEDTPVPTVSPALEKGQNIRLRISVANSGSEATDHDYLLEYAPKIGAVCGDDENFIAVPVVASTQHFEMRDSPYVTNGQPTTAKLTIPSCCPTFISGKIVEYPSNSSGAFTLPSGSYTDFEFVFWATLNATNGGSYCFRLTNTGALLNEYSVYPELQIAP